MPVQSAAHRYPRRAVLGIVAGGLAAGSGLGGCSVLGPDTRWRAADPLTPLLQGAVALADRYDAVMRALPALAPRLTALRDDHRAHAVALAREIGLDEEAPLGATPSLPGIPLPASGSASAAPSRSPAPTAIPAEPAAALAQLAVLERAAQDDAFAACLAAPRYRAATLGSIAACRASHVEALR